MTDPNPIVRYWATLGMVIGGKEAVAASADHLLKNMSDSSPDIRIAAAWALTKYGNPSQTKQGLSTLAKLAPGDQNNGYINMAALAAFDDCGQKTAPLKDQFLTWPTDGKIDDRARKACTNLMKSILLQHKIKVPKKK